MAIGVFVAEAIGETVGVVVGPTVAVPGREQTPSRHWRSPRHWMSEEHGSPSALYRQRPVSRSQNLVQHSLLRLHLLSVGLDPQGPSIAGFPRRRRASTSSASSFRRKTTTADAAAPEIAAAIARRFHWILLMNHPQFAHSIGQMFPVTRRKVNHRIPTDFSEATSS